MTRVPSISTSELEFTYARSSGPGGQNVNKVNSKAILRWNLKGSPSVSEDQRAILQEKLKLNEDGDLVIMSDRFRDQIRNREDCIAKFQELIKQSLHRPKTRRKTKPTRSSKLKAKEGKKHQSQKKSMRSFRY